MKTCFKCGAEKPLDDFYRHPKASDGYLGKCKECHKADVRTNYAAKRGQYQEYEAKRNATEHRRKHRRGAGAKHYWSNHDKAIARIATKRAVREGRLARGPCIVCGDPNTEAHHHDYSKPLDVEWFCFTHHREDHGQVPLSGYVRPVARPAAACSAEHAAPVAPAPRRENKEETA